MSIAFGKLQGLVKNSCFCFLTCIGVMLISFPMVDIHLFIG